MTDQQGTSALAFITRLEASRMARVMAAVRLGIGAIGVPTVLALRATAGRDLALGLGTALASKRGPDSLRGWLLAAAIADCCDALAIARNTSASSAVRAATALVSGLSAGTEIFLARRLKG